MAVTKWILLCVVLTTVHVVILAQDLNDTKQVLTDVLADYNRRIRPVADQNDVVQCTIGFTLFNLNEISDTSETMTTTGYLGIKWYDTDLVWDPLLYGNVTYIFLPQKEIWRPDVTLKNAAGDIEPLGDDTTNIEVTSDGFVAWYPFEKFVSECSIDVRYYPFDEQVCELEFAAWSYGTHQVQFNTSSDSVYMGLYKKSSQWELLEISMRTDDSQYEPTIFVTLKLKRKPLYMVLTVILPIALLAALDLLVFVLPVSSGEKIGYAVTVFLAFAVFLTLIEASMPKNAESVALMSIYMIVITANSTLITLLAILMTKVLSMENLAVPKVFVILSKIGRFDFSCCKKRKHKGSKVAVEPLSVTDLDEKGYAMDERCSSRSSASSCTDVDDQKKPTWESIMHGLEMFCLMFWSLVFIGVSLVIIIGAKTNTL